MKRDNRILLDILREAEAALAMLTVQGRRCRDEADGARVALRRIIEDVEQEDPVKTTLS